MILQRIAWRLVLAFLVVSPLPMAGMLLVSDRTFDRTLTATLFSHLSAVADKKADQIAIHMASLRADALRLARLLRVQNAMKEIIAARGGVVKPDYREIFLNHLDMLGHYDLLLMDTAGNVVFSVAEEADLGTNLWTGPWKESELARGFRHASDHLETYLSEFRPYAPSGGKAAAFVTTPVVMDGKVLGVLALQINLEQFLGVATDVTGLGSTGETVIGQWLEDKVWFMVPLRHVPNAAFRHHATFSRTSPPMKKAVGGLRGVGVTRDYAGHEVVAAWRYLPDTRWGMVVKMDANEAFAPLSQWRLFNYSALCALMVAAAWAAWRLGRAIVAPVRQLTEASRRIARGELEGRVAADGWAESRELADAFNAMTGALLGARSDLERKVRERTRDFREANRRLAELTTLQGAILDHAGYAIIATDPTGLITLFNRAAERMLGHAAEEMIRRQTPALFHDPEEVRDRARLFSRQLGEEIPVGFEALVAHARRHLPGEFEWHYVRKDGVRLPVLLSVTVLYDGEGGITGFLGMAVDISRRKEAEEALRRAREQAEELAREAQAANVAKSVFLANMSHEIRTPMNAILGLTRLVLEDAVDPAQREQLARVHESAKALLSLLNNILDYSKIEAGHLALERIPFRVGQTVAELARLFGASIEDKGLSFRVDVDPRAPEWVMGDPLRLGQVLRNLVDNALKFTQKGEIRLRVEVASRDEEAWVLLFSVADTGIGMTREQAERLFQPFTQGDATVSRRFGGTGLGLSICRRLVRAMGGEIAVSGLEGEGAVFTFTIRVGVAAHAVETGPPPESGPMAWEELAALQGARLLLVEDDSVSRRVIGEWLRRFGLAATLAQDGSEALERSAQIPFDLVLMDLIMPGMDGVETARRLRLSRSTEELPIIAMTASSMTEVREACLAAGMNDFLAKPVDPEELARLLLRWLAPSASTAAAARPVGEQALPPLAPLLADLAPYLSDHELPPERLILALRAWAGQRRDIEILMKAIDRFDNMAAMAAIEVVRAALPRETPSP